MSSNNHAIQNWSAMCYTYIKISKHDCADDRAMRARRRLLLVERCPPFYVAILGTVVLQSLPWFVG